MGPVRQNPIQRTVRSFTCVCIALCTIVAHNIAQNRPDNFPSYPPYNHHCSDDVYLTEGGAGWQRLPAYHSQQWADSSSKSWAMGSTSKGHSSRHCALLIAHLLQNIFQTDLRLTCRTPNYYN